MSSFPQFCQAATVIDGTNFYAIRKVIVQKREITGDLKITGEATMGKTLTADLQNLDPADANLTYQWFYSEDASSPKSPIPGAMGKDYVVEEKYVGKHLSVEVYAKKDNYDDNTFTDGIDTETNQSDTVTGVITGSVTITGENRYGEVLTAETTVYPTDCTLSYEWFYRDGSGTTGGTKIPDSTNSKTYQVGDNLIGKYIYVVVTASKTNYTTASFADVTDPTSNTSGTVMKVEFVPTVSMTDYVYAGIISTPSISNNVSGGNYQFYYNQTGNNQAGTPWTNMTSTSLDVGSYYLYVVVEETANYQAGTSAAVKFNVTPATITGSVTITGTALEGETLTVTNTIVPTDATLSYQWYWTDRTDMTGGTAIGGATSENTFVVPRSAVGKHLYVVVTATKANYTQNTFQDQIDETTNTHDRVIGKITGQVKITNEVVVGNTVQAVVTVDPSDATLTYQWYYIDSDGTEKILTGATGQTYTIARDLYQKGLRVKVHATKEYYTDADFEDTKSKILGKELTQEMVTLRPNTYVYNNTDREPEVIITYQGETLQRGFDFNVTYQNNHDAGTATAHVVGIGNYFGTLDLPFTITKAKVTLTFDDQFFLYDGNRITSKPVNIQPSYEDLSKWITYHYYPSIISMGEINVPRDIGTYYVRAELKGNPNYEDAISNDGKITIYGAPSAPEVVGTQQVSGKAIPSGGYSNQSLTIQISGSTIEGVEDAEVGYRYRFNESEDWKEYAPFSLTADGTYTIYAIAYMKDNPTLESEQTVYTVTIDTKKPNIGDADVKIPDILDSVVTDVVIEGEDYTDVWISEDPTPPDPEDEKWLHKGEGDEGDDFVFETSQGDEEKDIYVWVKDQAGNVSGPFKKRVTLSALKIGNVNENETNIFLQVTDQYLHVAELTESTFATYVEGTLMSGRVTNLVKTPIDDGYHIKATLQNVHGDGALSIGVQNSQVFDRAGNTIPRDVRLATNEITVDNTLPTVNISTYHETVFIQASDLHMKAILVNGTIIGRKNGTYEATLQVGKNRITVIDEYGNDYTQEIVLEEVEVGN